MRTFAVAILLLLLPVVTQADVPVEQVIKYSVCVDTPTTRGSGVVIQRGNYDFIWTVAHNLGKTQEIKRVLDQKTLMERDEITYQEVKLIKERYQNGRKTGETFLYGTPIRYSHYKGGEDLALIKIYEQGFFPVGAKFLDRRLIPKPSTGLWHIGNLWGKALDTPEEGMFGVAGRLRDYHLQELDNPKIYDQTTIPAVPGSSGGGVFLKSNGRCIGLLTQKVISQSETNSYIIPARRIYDYAKRAKCLWAVDESVPFCEKEAAMVVTDVPLEVPTKK